MNKKTIWITGASTGIGKALALRFAKEGWNVAGSARRKNLLEDLHKENNNIYSYPLDVTNSEDCKSVFKDSTNSTGIAPVLATQPNYLKALILTLTHLRLGKQRIVIAH